MAIKDMTGQRFGRLMAVSRASNNKSRMARWVCKCDCGAQTVVSGSDLRQGAVVSCGCKRREQAAAMGASTRKHGQGGKTRAYKSWISMKSRCYSHNCDHYPNYGGRGIAVCDRWRNSFENFFADMGPRPEGMTIDRVDVNGNYEPGNCRWATAVEQHNNTRSNHLIEFKGERVTVAEAARRAGVPDSRFRSRLRHGWSVERAMSA